MKPILDPMCGPKMFYFDKDNANVLFGDIRWGNSLDAAIQKT